MAVRIVAEKTDKTNLEKRKEAYPPVEEQLDMLWHAINTNPSALRTSEWFTTIQAIKNRYPL